MSKKGFTLVELLGVIVLLSVIVLVAFPNILKGIQKTDSEISEATQVLIETNARSYANDNLGKNIACVNVSTLIEEGYTKTPLANVSTETAEEMEENWSVKLSYDGERVNKAEIQRKKCS